MTAGISMEPARPKRNRIDGRNLLGKRPLRNITTKPRRQTMNQAKGMTVHLDEGCVSALNQLKRQIDAQAPDGMPTFSIQALARHAIRKWCDREAAPVPPIHEPKDSSEG